MADNMRNFLQGQRELQISNMANAIVGKQQYVKEQVRGNRKFAAILAEGQKRLMQNFYNVARASGTNWEELEFTRRIQPEPFRLFKTIYGR